MENKKPGIRAEDILTDELLLKKLGQEDLSPDEAANKEFELAGDIKRALKSSRADLSEDSKLALGRQLMASLEHEKKKRSLRWIAYAAALLVLIGIPALIIQNSDSGLRRFAGSMSPAFTSEYTRLILPDEKEVRVISPESKIDYSGSGTEINIEEQGTTVQQLPLNQKAYNTLVVPYGKRSRLKLPDNTVVWLNSGSTLVYPARFDQAKREVFLEGEAVFEVSHQENSDFYVLTRDLDVRVTGTVFGLSAYKDDQSVSTVLESGTVELLFSGTFPGIKSTEKMTAGNMAVYEPGEKTITQTKVNARAYTSWKDGYFICERNSLNDITKKLSRYYNVRIEFEEPALGLETFSGRLNLRDSAAEVLSAISEIAGTEIEQRGNLFIIRKRMPS
ncbi:MAG: FecR family protein [Mangrovibacterium sp.]